ncbi:hypothetical protein AMK31_37060 [Streptomyces sp. TSRI0107]|nr:hypothetical protein AMK31_37060 [Streptomyces sp. TSRI0107]
MHPFELMDRAKQQTWALADLRRACCLRAEDITKRLNVSAKNYRRFEAEGIVPSRSPRFVDDVADVLHVSRRMVENAMNHTPAVQRRKERTAELIEAMARTYVPQAGPWRGPSADDPALIELATAFGRPIQRIRRVLTYELGELRQAHVRAQRENVIARFDTDRVRQMRAREAVLHWHEVTAKDLAQIPQRLERFHRSAQPSDVWQLLVDLFNVDATYRPDTGNWAVTKLLCNDPGVLPRHMVQHRSIDDVAVCRLTVQGVAHVYAFTGLYTHLFPGVRRPVRPSRGRSRVIQESFTLPQHGEQLVVPDPFLESARIAAAGRKVALPVRLSPSYDLNIGTQSLSATTRELLLDFEVPAP